jgi:hypothetical protein
MPQKRKYDDIHYIAFFTWFLMTDYFSMMMVDL